MSGADAFIDAMLFFFRDRHGPRLGPRRVPQIVEGQLGIDGWNFATCRRSACSKLTAGQPGQASAWAATDLNSIPTMDQRLFASRLSVVPNDLIHFAFPTTSRTASEAAPIGVESVADVQE
jgi:hypothetical protein